MQAEPTIHFTDASSWATQWQHLFYFLMAVSIFFSTLIFGLIFYFAIKYRRRAEDEIPQQIEGNLALEITWTVIPAALCVVMFLWASALFFRNSVPPEGSTEIFVIGRQWMWKVQHSEGVQEINELHVPAGMPIKLTMTSQDVIHDFAVPAFRIKKDVLPGRYTSEWFTATETGRFHIFCDQYCGTSHSEMVGWLIVMEPTDYARWLGGGVAGKSMADVGAELYVRYGCDTCHSTGKGPPFAGLYGSLVKLTNGQTVIADDAYIRDCILTPSAQRVAGYPPIMPTFQGQLEEQQIFQLTAYIKSLTKTESQGRQATKQ
jgi:cytochrome c oxidase subunit II